MTLHDVAKAAHVSTATVSFYLNKPGSVSPGTSERIRRAIDELGYVRNSAASQLRSGTSRMLAFIGFDVSDPHFAAVARGARAAAAAEGLSLVLADTDGVRETEVDYVRLFEEQRVRGLLLAPAGDPTEYLADHAKAMPVVLVGHEDPAGRFPSVSVDNIAGGQLVGEHLTSLGRTRLAFAGGPPSIPQVADRLAGFREGSGRNVLEAPVNGRT
ncbi:MAG: LacI family DNA-binding transcriptional regulator, partial [Rhodoglobus sp.]|nr:LacI family DNA-binding transcriptional regulator [Rhodoglobus sp.]